MSDQSTAYPLQALFESALQDYKKQTGIRLANHSLTKQLRNCQSVESVMAILQEQAQGFSEFRGSDEIIKSLESVVSTLSRVSAIAAAAYDIGMVCHKLLIWCSTSLKPI